MTSGLLYVTVFLHIFSKFHTKWNQSVCILFFGEGLSCFFHPALLFESFIHVLWVSIVHFLLLGSISLYRCIRNCLCIHWWVDIGVVSNFRLLHIKTLWTFVCKYRDGTGVFLFLGEIPRSGMGVCCFWKKKKKTQLTEFSILVVPFYIPTRKLKNSNGSTSS